MDKGIAIDTLHSQLLTLSRSDRYGFDRFRCDWGKANTERYNKLKVDFCKSLRMLAKDCPVKYYNSSFYVFNGRIYESVDKEVVEQSCQLLLCDLYIGPMISSPSVMKSSFLDVIRFYNVLVPQFDIIAFSNGVVDFGCNMVNPPVMPFSPEYHVTYYHPYEYNPKAKCDRWLTFIHEVLPDRTSRLILQMFLGLGLIQRGVAYNPYEGKESAKVELCLLLVGTGANGKSVIFDVACQLFGKERISKMDYADLTADGDEGRRGRFPIRNAIFNWSSDSDPKKFGRKNTGMFKRLVSGEPVPVRQLGRDVLESNSIPYLIFNLNELPFPDDASLGFIRRLQFVNFEVTIPKERQDPDLASKIINKELPGVFNWVFRGMMELKKRKYRIRAAEGRRKQLSKSLLSSNPIMAWVRAYGIRSNREAPGEQCVWMNSTEMYQCFCRFCSDNFVESVPSNNKFGRDMAGKLCFGRKRTPDGNMYQVFGINMGELKESLLIDGIPGGEEDDVQPESFIKDDD